MENRFVYKIPGGKLLKITISHKDGKIISVKINGDFFAHPEDSIEKLELILAGKKISEIESAITEFLNELLFSHGYWY